MGDPTHDGLAVPGRVVLAHEPPFRIGALQVEPATRQVSRGERRLTLEPRVMQVLVALYQAGRIVTRDELIERCWDRRVVGDDAINRVVSRLRHLAGEFGDNCFSVETIARVGYRLVMADSGDAQRPPEARPAVDRRLVLGGAAVVAALAVAGAAAWWPELDGRNEPSPTAKSLFDQAVIIRQADNRQALAYLREAVRIAPGYGQAWGALALSYRIAIDGEAPERVAGFEERLQEAVRNAERHDPGNSDAAAALLFADLMFGQWSKLEPEYRAAIRRHPDHVAGYSLLGTLLMEVGRWADAVGVLRAAKARSPSSPIVAYKLILSLWSSGRISAAEGEIDRAMQLWPQHGAIWQTKIKLLALTGRPREALALARDPAARPLDDRDAPDLPGRQLFLTALATRSPADRHNAVDATVARARQNESERLNMALQATALGRAELALDMLEGIYTGSGAWAARPAARENFSTHPLFQPHARPLWREPRFDRILAAVGLEGYWQSVRTLPDFRRPG
jgi:DNA-binding winged helix-turn-helix (wHTH) protein/tetratricopeptide (TPR) repeat protein